MTEPLDELQQSIVASLEELKTPDRAPIAALTMLAEDNADMAPHIVSVTERHIDRVCS